MLRHFSSWLPKISKIFKALDLYKGRRKKFWKINKNNKILASINQKWQQAQSVWNSVVYENCYSKSHFLEWQPQNICTRKGTNPHTRFTKLTEVHKNALWNLISTQMKFVLNYLTVFFLVQTFSSAIIKKKRVRNSKIPRTQKPSRKKLTLLFCLL